MTKGRVAVVAVLVLGAVGLGYVATEAYLVIREPLPAPAPLEIWLPQGAEIRPASEVQSGTFAVNLTLQEFRAKFPSGGLVTFPPRPEWGSGRDEFKKIVFWKPGEGALFYRSVQEIRSSSSWPWYATVGALRLESGQLVAVPSNRVKAWEMGAAATTSLVLLFIASLTAFRKL